MIDPEGVEWTTPASCLDALPSLHPDTLRSWIRRGAVRSTRVGRRVWIAWPDVLEREAVATRSGWRRGRRHAERTVTTGHPSE